MLKDLRLLATYWQQHDEVELAHAALQLNQQLQQLHFDRAFRIACGSDISLGTIGANPYYPGLSAVSCPSPFANLSGRLDWSPWRGPVLPAAGLKSTGKAGSLVRK